MAPRAPGPSLSQLYRQGQGSCVCQESKVLEPVSRIHMNFIGQNSDMPSGQIEGKYFLSLASNLVSVNKQEGEYGCWMGN